MSSSYLPTEDEALSIVASWTSHAPDTRSREDILESLLYLSRTTPGRERIGKTYNVINNISKLLEDPLCYHERLSELAIRLLKNLCIRCRENQDRCREGSVHLNVIRCIENRLRIEKEVEEGEGERMLSRIQKEIGNGDGEGGGSLRMGWFGYAMEFLVNFVTCHEKNAEIVWKYMFPELMIKVLESDNVVAVSATTALLHNCVAILPERMKDVVGSWDERSENKNVASALMRFLHDEDKDLEIGKSVGSVMDGFLWAFLVMKRIIDAGMIRDIFEVVGPSLRDIDMSHRKFYQSNVNFSLHQITLLGVIEGAMAKTVGRLEKSQDEMEEEEEEEENAPPPAVTDIIPTMQQLEYFGELFKIAIHIEQADVARLAIDILSSGFLLVRNPSATNILKKQVLHQVLDYLNHKEKDSVPETGLRGSCIRFIATVCDGNKELQDMVRQYEAIPPILKAWRYDKDPANNPLMREWAILCIERLTADNAANREYVQELVRGTKFGEELSKRIG